MVQEELSITDKGDYVLVDFFGEFSVEAGKRCVDRMLEACSQYGRSAVLLDCRRMTGPLTVLDRFQVIQYGEITRGIISRLALVSRPGDILPDNFAESVAVNRGVNLRVFADADKAVEWLRM